MTVYTVPSGALRANSYLITEDGKNAILIDCGGAEPLAYACTKGLRIHTVLLTHAHFDHMAGCAAAAEGGAQIGVPEGDLPHLFAPENLGALAGVPVAPFPVALTFRGGDTLGLCGMSVRVIDTPGHTPGSVCFLCGDALFTGDTLFLESIGRTDFPGGDLAALRQSLQRLFALEGDCKVYPGHDEPTTLAHERAYNPYR